MAKYVPKRGDIVWLDFNPSKGHEQANLRPALVLSPVLYNSKVGLALVCPITSKIKNYPFEVLIPKGLAISGVVLSDQIRNVDWSARKVKYIDQLPETVLLEVKARLNTLIN